MGPRVAPCVMAAICPRAYTSSMGAPRLKPRFELATQLSAREIDERLRAHLEDVHDTLAATFIGTRVEIVPHHSTVRFWSPQLTLDIDEREEHAGATRIRAKFGPHPHVWSMYLAIHAVGAFGTLGAAMFGISQHLAGESPWALWALPISPLLAGLVWAMAFVAQSLGAEQMYMLRKFVEKSIEAPATSD